MNDEIIKCNKCGHVLVSGKGATCFFGVGSSIECGKCGNKYVFGDEVQNKFVPNDEQKSVFETIRSSRICKAIEDI